MASLAGARAHPGDAIDMGLTLVMHVAAALSSVGDPPSGSLPAAGASAGIGTGLDAVLRGHWMVPAVGAAIVLLAYLFNRFAPAKRRRLRRLSIVFALYVAALLAGFALTAVGAPIWAERLRVTADLFEAFTLINLVALALFELALPAVSLDVVSITSDILIGVAYIFATLGVLRGRGMDVSSVIATSAIVSGVLALSLQATLGNILGGVALQLDGSVHVGDWLRLENQKEGRVREIRWRHTVVETRDWDTIIVPNASLLSGNITILGKRDGLPVPHRMWVYFNVDFRYPPSRVVEVVTDALLATPIDRVAREPRPQTICYDLGAAGKDSFAVYAVRYWLDDLATDDPTSSLVRERIHAALKRAGIPLARPAQTMFVTPDDESEEKRRDERHRERRLRAVQNNALFRGLNDDEQAFVADRLVFAPFSQGEIITRQGAVAHWLYLLTSGRVEIRVRPESAQGKALFTVEAPSFFGEMGLMTGEPRAADVVAVTTVECFRLDKDGFEKIIKERPVVAEEMSKTLARRRVELITAREGLDRQAQQEREVSEQKRIFGRIQAFFGLNE
jgi:small-conductance mechanosensitive channel/CRP-like cAMP-binding protein